MHAAFPLPALLSLAFTVLVRRNMAVALRLGGKTSEADKIEAAIALEDPMMLGQSLPQSHIMAQAGDIGLPGTGRLDRWMECDLYVTEGGWLDVVLETCQILDGERFLKDGVIEDPTDISAWYQLGVFYRNHDRVWDCARVLSHLLRLRGDYAPAWAVLGGALADNKNYSLSVRPLKNALARNPGDLYARSNLILSLAWTCQWDQNGVHIPVFIEQLSKGLAGDLASFPAPAHMMFIVAGMADSFPLGVYRAWVDKWSAEMTSRVDHTPFLSSYPQYRQGERLRIGYVSGAGFQRSPGSSAIRGIFELHDRGRFEVLCFALKPFLHGNDLRGNISASCDRFVELGDVQDDRDLAWRVNAHKPHVIIDLSGFSGDHRIRMLAHRPAPLSLTFLEYPGTLGAATGIDGIVTDRIASPPEYRLAYSEALLSVPPPYLPNDYRATVPPPSDALAAFPQNQDLTFCALHHVWKMDSEVFSAWMHILSTFPSSALRLQGCSDDAKESLRAKAQSLGVDPNRLVFNQKLSTYSEHIEKLSKCSLFFDAPRYNAHTSAADALWAGVPVLTLPFQMMVHRGAACLVRSVGLDSAISRNMEDYILIAKAISKSSGSLEMIRSQLRRGRQDKALFDTKGWTLAIERGILMMFESKMLMQVPRAREAVAARSANPTSFHIIPIRGP